MSGKDAIGNGDTQHAEAEVRRRRLSWVWLIPIACLAIGGWLVWTTIGNKGPLIRITFETAEGLQAGQSMMKYKDIQMGTVEGFDLTKERRVVMRVRTTPQAEPFLEEGTQFWVAKPRLFAGDITGLNTVLSGSYIEMAPAEGDGPRKREFKGLEDPPPAPPGTKGRVFRLVSKTIGSLSVGSPVFYRNVEVGKVTSWKLTGMAEKVTLEVLVNTPYDSWVHDDSRFWDTSGINLRLDGSGVRLEVDSMKAALLGGVTFETPPTPGAKPSDAAHSFELFKTAELAEAATAQRRATLASYLTGTVGGLTVGAPVMLMGIRVGDVTKVELQYDTETSSPRVRAEYVVEMNKVHLVGGGERPPFPENFRRLVEQKGLRARLKGGSIITGQKTLSLEFDSSADKEELKMEDAVLVIPVQNSGGGGLDDLSSSATALLDKIGKIPFPEIGRNLNATLGGANQFVNSPKLQSALDELNKALSDAQQLLRNANYGMQPVLQRMPAISAELQAALTQIRTLAAGLSSGTQGSSHTGRDLDRALSQVGEAADSIRALTDLLGRHPEALIRGRSGESSR